MDVTWSAGQVVPWCEQSDTAQRLPNIKILKFRPGTQRPDLFNPTAARDTLSASDFKVGHVNKYDIPTTVHNLVIVTDVSRCFLRTMVALSITKAHPAKSTSRYPLLYRTHAKPHIRMAISDHAHGLSNLNTTALR